MQTYLKSRPVWVQLLLFIGLAFGIFMVLGLLGTIIYTSVTDTRLNDLMDLDLTKPDTVHHLRFMQTLQFFGLFVIPVWLFAYFSDPSPAEYLGLRKPTAKRYWIYGVLAMMIAIPLVTYTGVLNQQITFDESTQQWIKSQEEAANKMIEYMLNRRTPWELFLNIIFIAVLAGVGEELFFRGVLQRLFIRAFRSPWAGIILTAIIFSAIHMQFLGFIPRVIMGIILGAIYWYSGSLWAAILAHFFYDAFLIVLTYFNPHLITEDPGEYPQSELAILAVVSAVLTGVIVWLMKKQSKTRYQVVYENDKPKDPFSS